MDTALALWEPEALALALRLSGAGPLPSMKWKKTYGPATASTATTTTAAITHLSQRHGPRDDTMDASWLRWISADANADGGPTSPQPTWTILPHPAAALGAVSERTLNGR